ncbi:MAG: hypothetical protein JNL12_05985 [Planctomycetes bacterium]|nr:hypothetical protein [Planctomycetota bacterium]
MWAARFDEGYVFGDITPASAATLKGVPMLLESADVRVRQRLLPETCDDPEDEQQWRQHAVPELERLFASRAQLVRTDLAALRPMPKSQNQLLLIPFAHTNAWLAALNAARLALFVLNELTAESMEPDAFATVTPKQQEALLRIHLLAEVQSVLLGDLELEAGGAFADFVIE